jgi:hypothetical protein
MRWRAGRQLRSAFGWRSPEAVAPPALGVEEVDADVDEPEVLLSAGLLASGDAAAGWLLLGLVSAGFVAVESFAGMPRLSAGAALCAVMSFVDDVEEGVSVEVVCAET